MTKTDEQNLVIEQLRREQDCYLRNVERIRLALHYADASADFYLGYIEEKWGEKAGGEATDAWAKEWAGRRGLAAEEGTCNAG